MTNNEAELREKLAAIEHERWADWQKYCHKVIRQTIQSGGSLEEVLERWDRQINTPYAALSEREQASDMEQVDLYWHLLSDHTRKARLDELRRARSVDSQLSSADIVEHLENRIAALKQPTVEEE